MTTPKQRNLLAACVAGAVLVFAGATRADGREEAKRHFEAGMTLLETDDFAGAAAAFESSVRDFPTKTSLFNLANCYKALQRYGESLEVLHRLDAEFGGAMGEELEAETAKLRRTLENLVGHLVVESSPTGATIRVDGREAGKAPLGRPLVLGPGDHEVEASLEGYAAQKRIVRVESRGDAAVSFELQKVEAATPEGDPDSAIPEPVAPPPPPPPPAERPAAGHGALWTGGWVVAGLGAAIMVAGGVTGGMALATGNELESDYPDGVPRDKKSEVDGMDRLAVATDVLLGVGGAALVAGVVMLVVDVRSESDDVAFVPAAGPGFAGASLAGRF
jgi:hypothetical protein